MSRGEILRQRVVRNRACRGAARPILSAMTKMSDKMRDQKNADGTSALPARKFFILFTITFILLCGAVVLLTMSFPLWRERWRLRQILAPRLHDITVGSLPYN